MTRRFKPGDVVRIPASQHTWRVRAFDEGDQVYIMERADKPSGENADFDYTRGVREEALIRITEENVLRTVSEAVERLLPAHVQHLDGLLHAELLVLEQRIAAEIGVEIQRICAELGTSIPPQPCTSAANDVMLIALSKALADRVEAKDSANSPVVRILRAGRKGYMKAEPDNNPSTIGE